MKRARFTKQARAELLAQISYYEKEELGLGARFRKEVESAAQRAAAFPQHGKPGSAGTRKRRVVDFKISVVYTETDFPTSEAVNEALRGLLTLTEQTARITGRAKRPARKRVAV